MKDKIQALVAKLDTITKGQFGSYKNGFVTSDVQAVALHKGELELLCKSITDEFSDGSAIRVSKPTLNADKDGLVVFISKSTPKPKKDMADSLVKAWS